jgi:hypothetical protein
LIQTCGGPKGKIALRAFCAWATYQGIVFILYLPYEDDWELTHKTYGVIDALYFGVIFPNSQLPNFPISYVYVILCHVFCCGFGILPTSHEYVYVSVCVCLCLSVFACLFVSMSVSMSACVAMSMSVYVYVCVLFLFYCICYFMSRFWLWITEVSVDINRVRTTTTTVGLP